MAERLSALAHLPAKDGGSRVTLRQVSAGTILRIQAWPDTAGAVSRVASERLGIEAPAIGYAATRDATSLISVSPGVFYVAGLAADLAGLIKEALPPTEAAVTDWSHARSILSLEGEAAADILQKFVALDLSAVAFPPGRAAVTMIHHIDVLIHRRSDTEFQLWALRSFVAALAEWVLDAGIEEGIALQR